MNINITSQENTVLVTIEGRLDTANAVEAEKSLAPLKEYADKEIELDCTTLEYISSSGLRILLALRKDVDAKGGKLIVKHINDSIRNVFTITGFFKLFDIRP